MELSGNRLKIGVIIAVEHYQRHRLATAEFARADAVEMGEVFRRTFGIAEPNLHWFIDAEATSGSLQRDLRRLFASLPVGCEFYLYYAGHGFFQGENWLSVFDTSMTALEESALSLTKHLCEPLEKAKCHRALLWLDLRTQALETGPLQQFVEGGSDRAFFVSCQPGESSLTSNKLGHGIWNWHLTKALQGEFPESLTRDRAITGELLQKCLKARVKSFLRDETTLTSQQTPFHLQASGTLVLARFDEDKVRAADTVATLAPDFRRAYWRSESRKLFKKYTGFSKAKGHFVPTRITSVANQWAEELVAEEASDEISELYENCVTLLHNKRSEMNRGLLSVDCDQFRFSINVSQDPSDPARVLLVRKVELPAPLPELPEDFDSIFPIAPDQLVVPFAGNISYAEVLKKFEALEARLKATLREVDHGKVIELRFPSKVSMVVDLKHSQIRFYKSNVRGVLRLMGELFHDLNELGLAQRLPILQAP